MTLPARCYGNHAPTSTGLCVFNVPPSPGQRQAVGPAPATAPGLAGRGRGRGQRRVGPRPRPLPAAGPGRRAWARPGEGGWCQGWCWRWGVRRLRQGDTALGARQASRPPAAHLARGGERGPTGGRCGLPGPGVSEACQGCWPQRPETPSGQHQRDGGVPGSPEGPGQPCRWAGGRR